MAITRFLSSAVSALRQGSKRLTAILFASILIAGSGAASAMPINLAALGLVAEPAPFATESVAVSLFAGVAFDANNLLSPGAINVAVAGSAPFGAADFGLSAFPVVGAGTLTGASSAAGWDVDLVEILIDVGTASGSFSGVSAKVLVSLSGSFGSDPLGLSGGGATLGMGVPATVTLTNVNAIPVPAALPMLAVAIGGLAWVGRRYAR